MEGTITFQAICAVKAILSLLIQELTTKVVLSLIDGLYNQGYRVVLDNLYTSPQLLRTLIENGTDSFSQQKSIKKLQKQANLDLRYLCKWLKANKKN